MKKFTILMGLFLATVITGSAFAHGGGLNSQGCHNKTSDGTYHCHRSQNKTNKQSQPKNNIKEGYSCVATQSSLDKNLAYNQSIAQRTFYYNVSETGFFMTDTNGSSSWVPLTGKNNFGSYIKTNISTVLEVVNDKKKSRMTFNKRTGEFFVEWVNFWGVSHDGYGTCSKIN